MNLKAILLNNKIYGAFMGLPLAGKIGTGIGAAMMGSNIISALYSRIFTATHFSSMHSGKDSSLSSYSTKAMTDFGSGWQGISKNVTRWIGAKNRGLSETIKTVMTPFTNNGIDLGRTMKKIARNSSRKKHVMKRVNLRDNVVLNMHKNKIQHMIME